MNGPDLFDILSGADEVADHARAGRAAWMAAHAVRPDTGEPCGNARTWCGRCGAEITLYDLVINHDLGYCGCPSDLDPVFSLAHASAPGWRPGSPLDKDGICVRWDRQFYADCASCGHPWGLHDCTHGGGAEQTGVQCYVYCGCQGYEAAA